MMAMMTRDLMIKLNNGPGCSQQSKAKQDKNKTKQRQEKHVNYFDVFVEKSFFVLDNYKWWFV